MRKQMFLSFCNQRFQKLHRLRPVPHSFSSKPCRYFWIEKRSVFFQRRRHDYFFGYAFDVVSQMRFGNAEMNGLDEAKRSSAFMKC